MPIDPSKLLDGNALLAIRDYIQTYYQPLNANLTTISSLPTNATGLIKMTNGVASIDSSAYKTDYRYRPIKVGGTTKLANTSATALDFVNPESGYNVVFEWDSTNNGVKATVDLSGYQPLDADLTAIAALSGTSGFLKKTAANTWTLDATTYAPLASPTFTGTVTLPTTVKIGTSTSTGLVKYTNGVLSIDTSSYKTDYRYRPIKVNGTQQLANTSSTALDFVNTGNVTFEWVSASNGVKATVDLSGYQPLSTTLTAIAALPITNSGFLKYSSFNTSWSLATLAASDIPNLDASKITSGTFADARIASASTWNAKYTKPSGGIPASDLAESYILTSAKGAANGVASLGSDGKVPTSQLPSSVTGGMQYKGTFDASLGTTIPGLTTGWYYVCSAAGNKNPDGTSFSDGYEIGDWAVYNGSSAGWAKIDNSDKVSSVNGKTGAVTLNYSDVGAASSGHTHTITISETPNDSGITLNFGGKYYISTGGTSAFFKLASLPSIPSVSLTTTVGSEAITVDSSSLTLVTRDTAQEIGGKKTFTGDLWAKKGLQVFSTGDAMPLILTGSRISKGGGSGSVDIQLGAAGRILDNTGTYGLKCPVTSGWSGDKTIATTDQIPTISTYSYQEALDILESTD